MMKKLNALTIVGVSVKTTNTNNQAQIDIQKLWETFLQKNISSQIVHKQDEKVYVVYTDYEGDFTKPYRVIIGHTVSDSAQSAAALDNVIVKKIPAFHYEIFDVSGKYPECLIKAWQDIWASNLNRAYVADLEVYEKNFDPNHAKLAIYISIKS